MKQRFDAVVIGAGMMGSAAARYLSMEGVSVAVIGPAEPATPHLHEGPFASHYDEARITRKLDKNPDWSRLSARSIARYRALEDETGIRFFHETGAIMAMSPDHRVGGIPERVASVNRQNDVDAHIIERGHESEPFPYLQFPSTTVIAHEATEAGYINPRAHIRAQLTAAVQCGATNVEGAVRSVAQQHGSAFVTLTDGHRIEAGTAIVACGAYSGFDGLLPERVPLKVLARTIAFAEVNEVQQSRFKNMPSIVYFAGGLDDDLYVLPPVMYPDGKCYIKIGGDPVDCELTTVEDLNSWFRSTGDETVARYLLDHLSDLIPDLKPVSTWFDSCATSYTPTGMPLIYRQSDNIVVLTGGNGAGAKNADEVGRLGAKLALEGTICDEGYSCDFGPG